MINVDNKFLEDNGLGALSPEKKEALLEQVRSTLEERVGGKLTESMSDSQIDEFGQFLDGDSAFLNDWFSKNDPNYAESEAFKNMKKYLPDVDEVELMAEYGAMRWLQLNRPDYPEIVKNTLNEIGAELSANKDRILAS